MIDKGEKRGRKIAEYYLLRAIKDLLQIVTARVTNGIQTVGMLVFHYFSIDFITVFAPLLQKNAYLHSRIICFK